MARTKLERAEELEAKIRKMENERKELLQKHKEEERKSRTHRLCKRGGLLESIFPDTLNLTDDQFKNFLEMTMLTEYTRSRYADARSGKLSHHSSTQAKSAKYNDTAAKEKINNNATAGISKTVPSTAVNPSTTAEKPVALP